MANRIIVAFIVGLSTGLIMIISNLLLAVIGFVGGFAIPFFGIATSVTAWVLSAIYLVSAGWLVSNYSWSADRKSAIKICSLTGIIAGVISQTVNLLIGLVFSVFFGALGAFAGYLVSGGKDAITLAILGGIGGLLLGAAVTFVQFFIWVILSVVFCAIGGIIYSSKAGKQRPLSSENAEVLNE